jgi:hypothetical protein
MALQRFRINPEGKNGHYVEVECRRRGLRGMIRAALGLDVHVYLDVDADHLQFRDEGLFRESYHTIPITSVRAVTGGFVRPLGKLVAAFLLGLMSIAGFVVALLVAGDVITSNADEWLAGGLITGIGLLLVTGILVALYSRQKRLFLEFEYGGTGPKSIVLQRSWNRLINLQEVRRAIEVINRLILDANRVDHETGPVVVLSDRVGAAAEVSA